MPTYPKYDFLCTSLLLLFPIIFVAQKKDPRPLPTNKTAHCKSTFLNSFNTYPEENAVLNYIHKKPLFRSKNVDAKLVSLIDSPYGKHYTFLQTYKGIIIYNAQVKINTDRKGHILSEFDNSFKMLQPIDDNFPDDQVVNQYLQKQGILKGEIEIRDEKKNYYPDADSFLPVLCTQLFLSDGSSYEILLDKFGNLLKKRDLLRYSGKDSIAKAMVFLPDPLTTANVEYGTPYVDNEDKDNLLLNEERVMVEIMTHYESETFFLENDYVKITEHSNPVTPTTISTTGNFDFNRSEPSFEDVNVYYHISAFQEYIQSLGFNNLANYQIHVDAHAFNGQDNSTFTPNTNPPRLNFGEGGVDDAEDADVIIHEYTHALHSSASPLTFIGSERTALEEANGDYFAASYSKEIDPYNWENVYSWDGHNEFWNGRTVTTSKKYPEDLVGDLYTDANIWSSTLMQISDAIGKEKTDKILLQSIYSYASNMSMEDAANLLIQADSLIYNGDNYSTICSKFFDRGLVSNCVVGINEHSHKNVPVMVNSASFRKNQNVVIKWEGATNYVFSLYDTAGKLLLQEKGKTDELTLPGMHLSPGFYLLHLVIENTNYTYKLIK